MRVLVWNMNKRRAAWEYVRRNATNFDVALLQEAHDPRSLSDGRWRSAVWTPYSREQGSRLARSGCAVIAPGLELEPFQAGEDFPWLNELSGYVTVARSAKQPTWLASVHAHSRPVPGGALERHAWDDVPLCNPGRKVWQMDLIPFELHRLFAGRTFLWGDDLNSAVSMDGDPGFSGGSRRLREIWHEAGSRDLRSRFFTDEQQTFFARNRRPFQLDHVFGDAVTESRVVSWHVDRGPATVEPTLSDHAPIWVELE